jgi:hypothetical protein
MNPAQRLLVIAALVVIGLALAFVFFDWGEGAFKSLSGDRIAVLVSYHDPAKRDSIWGSGYGIYTMKGIPGIILGLIPPLCLFTAAAFVALGTRHGKRARSLGLRCR